MGGLSFCFVGLEGWADTKQDKLHIGVSGGKCPGGKSQLHTKPWLEPPWKGVFYV